MHCKLAAGCGVAELTGNSTQAIKDFERIVSQPWYSTYFWNCHQLPSDTSCTSWLL